MTKNQYLRIPILLLLLSTCIIGFGQQKFTVNGYVEDRETGEKLIEANILDVLSSEGTVSNTYGFYSFTKSSSKFDLIISYIGYEDVEVSIDIASDTTITFQLSSSIDLQEVVISAEATKIQEETQMSQITVPVDQIKQIPALLGEVDVMKALQFLPGVSGGSEGQTGLYVRGGSPDQNLILLDGVPIYNAAHVLGIFSVFNADALRNVTLIKGGFPARYGGRLSSILDISMKEGNLNEFHGEGSIGLITSKLTLEGPINKGKTSFLISGRRTYIDLITKPIIKKQAALDDVTVDPKLFFYDVNAKLNHKFNDNHRLFLSAYLGQDIFFSEFKEDDFSSGGGIDWGNLISALRWNWKINNRLFANTTLTFSDYLVDISASQSDKLNNTETSFSAKYKSGIKDWGGKIDFDFVPNPQHYIRFGAGVTHHTYAPGAIALAASAATTNLDTLIGTKAINSVESNIYIEDDINFGALKANVGLHGAMFSVEGKNYTSLQPRIGLRYLMGNDWAIKASYTNMSQFINLLTSESFSLPTDLWVPSTSRIKPQRAWQAAIGVAKSLGSGLDVSLEAYYKKMQDVISFKEGASFLLGLQNDWQDKIIQGDGEAYGLEVLLQKKKGKTTGWLGYTLAWNNRQFDEINNGSNFPYRYDRRHDLSFVVSHQLKPRILLSAAWIYATGNAVTLPVYRFSAGNQYEIESLGEKNAFRMSDTHRLDLSIEFKKKKKKYERTWVIGVYNAYWHKNPYFIVADNKREILPNGQLGESRRRFREVSVLPIIPSVAYKFKF